MSPALATYRRAAAAGWRQSHAATMPTYYASTTGASGNAGTQASPWDLTSVLGGSHAQLNGPSTGATVYLRGGTYPGSWTVGANIKGTNPFGPFDPRGKIHIRAFPGETVVLTDSLSIPLAPTPAGTDIWWWDITVQNTNVGASNVIGIDAHAARHGFVRVIVHDQSGDGFGGWVEGPDCFWVQCAAFNNGFTGSDPSSSFGHGYYIENQTGFKRLYGCMAFNQFGYGFHHYASGSSFLNNGDFQYCAGLANGRKDGYDFIFGGGPPLVGFNCDHPASLSWTAAPAEQTPLSIGYTSDQTVNTSGAVTNGFLDGGRVLIEWWDSPGVLNFSNNKVGQGLHVDFLGASANFGAGSAVDNNAYNYTDAFDPFEIERNAVLSTTGTIAGWRTLLGGGFETHSTLTANANIGSLVQVWLNPLDPGHGKVDIKNPSGASTVNVDVSSIVPIGGTYNVFHHHSLNASPVLTGSNYPGGTLAFPMNPALPPPAMLGGTLRSVTPIDARPFAGIFWVSP